MKLLLFILYFISVHYTLVAQTSREMSLKLAKTLGYSYGVSITMDIIKERFPDLQVKAMVLEDEFKNKHGRAIDSMEQIYSKVSGFSTQDLKNYFVENYIDINAIKNLDINELNHYLETFREKIIYGNNELTEPFVKDLLRFNRAYAINPYKEFTDGFKTILNTKNHLKSKGVNFRISCPKSWDVREGERPNVIYLAKSNESVGDIGVTLIVNDMKSKFENELGKLTEEDYKYINSTEFQNDILSMLLSEEYKTDIGKEFGILNPSFYTSTKVNYDGQYGVMIFVKGEKMHGEEALNAIIKQYIILYKYYTIYIGFYVFGNSQIETEVDYNRFETLIPLMMNSFVLDSKWK